MNDTIGNAAPAKPKRARTQTERGLTPAQIKTVAYLGRVGIATERAIQEANVSDRTPRTLETLERDGYIRRVEVAGAVEVEIQGGNGQVSAGRVSMQALSLTLKGVQAVAALRGLLD